MVTTNRLATLLIIICGGSVSAFAFAPATTYDRHQRFSLSSTTSTEEVTVNVDDVATINNPRKEGLALMLDDGTRKSHSMAENTAFVSGFFKGIATKEAFGNLVTSLYYVYKAQEEAFDTTNSEYVKSLDYTELRRLQSLENDMQYFYGDDWKSKIVPSAGTQKYVSRIQEIAKSDQPELLIAHQYTRYLGDLFGGQMMGGMASKSLGLQPGEGTSFYSFDGITDTREFIDVWYANLNKLDLTLEQKNAIVDEANNVFALNIDILEELEGSPFKAMLMLAVNSLKEKRLWAFKD